MMEKPWLKEYPSAIPENIDPDCYTSIAELFNASVAKYTDRVAIENLNVKLSYAQLSERVMQLAAYFQHVLHLEKGDRIAIMLPNCLQYVISMLAAFKAGLTVVNVNPMYTARELTHQLNDAQPKAIIVLANVANTLAEVLPTVSLAHIIITELGDAFPMHKALAVNFTLKYIKKCCRVIILSPTLNFVVHYDRVSATH